MNIKFNYLYRDFSNYKNYNSIVLSNPNNFSINEIDKLIREYLIDGEYFEAEKIGIPSLFFEEKNEDDHEWHEFESLQVVKDLPYNELTIEDLLNKLKLQSSNKL